MRSGLRRGAYAFVVKLYPKGLRALRKRGKLKLTLRLTVRPPGLKAIVVNRTLTVKR